MAWLWRVAIAAVLVGSAWWAWQFLQPEGLPPGVAGSNGRIEAVEIDIATRSGGRVEEVLLGEGDFVQSGEEVARMDSSALKAQLREARAQVQRARIGVDTARSQVRQREAEKEAAQALAEQRRVERDAADKRLRRAQEMDGDGWVSEQTVDDRRAEYEAARSAVAAATAQVAAADAALGNARSAVVDAEATVDAAEATVERIQSDIDDNVLVAPRDGRIQYRVAQPGEVLSPGGIVVNMVDLTDVYMTFFLPTEVAGRLALGSEVRLVLDAAPQYVIPAEVSFVADVAQFTPQTVETREEREKLMFRIKATIDPELLREHLHQVKTGLPGMAYVLEDPQADWPEELQVRLPE